MREKTTRMCVFLNNDKSMGLKENEGKNNKNVCVSEQWGY
jgi:hypothetical protein